MSVNVGHKYFIKRNCRNLFVSSLILFLHHFELELDFQLYPTHKKLNVNKGDRDTSPCSFQTFS